MSNVETYVLGNKMVPNWLNAEAAAGRVKMTYNEDGEIENAKVISGVKSYIANVGDTIMKTKSGLVVIGKEKAKKYMAPAKPVAKKVEVPVDIKEEDKNEELEG